MSTRIGSHLLQKAKHAIKGMLWPGKPGSVDSEFLDILRASQGTILKVCLYYSDRTPDGIRDMFQDIACALWEAWPSYKADSSIDTWVHSVALHTAVSQLRGRAKMPQFVALEDWMYDSIADEAATQGIDHYALVQRLSPKQRALVLLRLQGKSYREMGQILGLSEDAAKQHLFRIRQKLDTMKQKEQKKINL